MSTQLNLLQLQDQVNFPSHDYAIEIISEIFRHRKVMQSTHQARHTHYIEKLTTFLYQSWFYLVPGPENDFSSRKAKIFLRNFENL